VLLPAGPLRALTSTGVGARSTWLDDGRIVYPNEDGAYFELVVDTTGEGLAIGTPRPILGERRPDEPRLSFSRDGKRILAAIPTGEPEARTVTIVQGWPSTVGLE
jgi:hypothetical protein